MFSTFVINLDKDTDRLEYMNSQLSDLGVPYERVSAIRGLDYIPKKEEYEQTHAYDVSGYVMTPGELGCALSHAKIIQKIVTEEIPYTLILEDDVTLPVNFKDIIEDMIKKNKNWEHVLFDYIPVGLPFFRQWLVGVKINYRKLQHTNEKFAFIAKHVFKAIYIFLLSLSERVREFIRTYRPGPVIFLRPVYFAGAYLVSLEGAKKLHALCNPVVYTADQLPNKARELKGLKFRGFSPLVVQQEKKRFGSSILDLKGEEINLAYKNKH